MKKFIFISLITGVTFFQYGCTDIAGDGIDTVVYNGSQVPEDSAYLNPVWNFDLTDASVFLSSGPFYAMGEEKQWAAGIQYVVPTLTTNNLMDWALISQAQAFLEKPDWAEGNVVSVTGLFSKSIGMYYLYYQLGVDGLGVADARTPQGPYNDYGKFTDKEALGVSGIEDPFVYALGSNFYLFFGVPGDGIYGVKLSVRKNEIPTLAGTKFKIAGPGYAGPFVRKRGTSYYLFGTCGGSIVIGKATSIEGPYLDQAGVDLVQSAGTPLVLPTEDFLQLGEVSGIQQDYQDEDWILYTAIEAEMPSLPTGLDRYVLLLNKVTYDGNGWPAATIEARSGYCYPRYKN
jgi:arabinan endo-1,5-alpha-L-arabinosidase